jgi:alpha-glucosidase
MAELAGPLRRQWLKTKLVWHEVTALSPTTMRAIAANSVTMARSDRRDHAAEQVPATPVAAGRFLGAAPREVDGAIRGVTVAFERATLDVAVMAPDMVRLSWGPDDEPVPWATSDPIDVPEVGEVRVEVSESEACVETDHLVVTVTSDGARVHDVAGALRYHELLPLRRGASRTHRRRLRPSELLFGFGEQAMAGDLRGSTVRFFNRDPGGAWGTGQNPLYCSIPVTIGRHSDGAVLVFHENPSDATATVGPPSDSDPVDVEIRFLGGMLRTWVVVGDEATVLERYTGLTGRHPLPPRWALGYHHSRWGYGSTDELTAVIDGFADRGIPLSVLHLDIDYMDKYRVFSVDEERFSGLVGLASSARAVGTRLVTIIDPAIRRDPGYDVYDEGIEAGYFVHNEDGTVHVGTVWPGWAVFPDFTARAVRSWWASFYERILDHGVAGIWHDMNEPTSITLAGDRTLPRSARHDNDGRGGDHREVHNVYGLLMNRAGAAGLRAARPERRPFIVSRSGWAGMQRDAWNWTADVEATTDGLRQQVTTFLGLGLSGVAFTGSDLGGFSGIPSPELYLRWLELGVISPFCRTHSVIGAPAREPWCWPEETAQQVARLIALRYRLLPYLYTLAAQNARTGAPLLRPLWWGEGPDVTFLEHCDDALKVGDDLVFALQASTKAGPRAVPLPAGSWWLWRSVAGRGEVAAEQFEQHTGGGEVLVEGTMGQPLLFIRAGSILPLDDAWADGRQPSEVLTESHAPQALTFHVFADERGSARGSNFDDAGDGDGPTRTDHLVLEGDLVRWGFDGSFERPSSVSIVLHGMTITAARVDGRPLGAEHVRVGQLGTVLTVPSFERLELLRR